MMGLYKPVVPNLHSSGTSVFCGLYVCVLPLKSSKRNLYPIYGIQIKAMDRIISVLHIVLESHLYLTFVSGSWSRDSAVGIATGYGLEDPGIGV
jgi:hypothetical protein